MKRRHVNFYTQKNPLKPGSRKIDSGANVLEIIDHVFAQTLVKNQAAKDAQKEVGGRRDQDIQQTDQQQKTENKTIILFIRKKN